MFLNGNINKNYNYGIKIRSGAGEIFKNLFNTMKKYLNGCT